MGKIKRGGFIFFTWKGDHDPRHVHVYDNGKLILKWDLDNHRVINGKMNRKLNKLIKKLATEGKI